MTYWVQRNSTKKVVIGIIVLVLILGVSIPLTVFAITNEGNDSLTRVASVPLAAASAPVEAGGVEAVQSVEAPTSGTEASTLAEVSGTGVGSATATAGSGGTSQAIDTPADLAGEEVPTTISISPTYGAVGTEVDITITIASPFIFSKIGDIRVEAIKDGPIRFLPETFIPVPAAPLAESGDISFLVWEGLEVVPGGTFNITGKGRISGPRDFTIYANSQGKKEIVIAGGAEDGGIGSGRGVTSSLRDTQDSLLVGDLFEYIVEIEGQADAPESFMLELQLPDQVTAESVEVDVSGVLAAGSCRIEAAQQLIVCDESRVEQGGTMTVTVNVRADQPGYDDYANSVKARLVVTYPETGIEVASEEVTFIYK